MVPNFEDVALVIIDVQEKLVADFPAESLWEVYGSTELGVDCVLAPADQLRKPGSCGLAAPGASAQASPSTGQPATQQPDASGSVAVTLPPLQTPTPFPSASGDPVLVGAGDIR